eukprot:scaffold75160_cov33-Phaeocystis_antarctica.AAC.2
MARELKKRVAEIEQLESKCEILREARGADIVVAEKVKVEAEEAASRSVEVLKKEVAKLKITAERHETQQHEHVESFKAEKLAGRQGSSKGGEAQGGGGCSRMYAEALTIGVGGGNYE